MITVASVDLHAFVHHIIERLGSEDLDHGAFSGKIFGGLEEGLAGILNMSSHAVNHALIDVHPYRHLGKLVLYQTELGDGFAESASLFGIANRIGQYLAAFPMSANGQVQAAEVEDIERDDVPASNLTQNVFHGDLDVVEKYGRCGAALQTHLLLFRTGRNAGPRAFD